MSIYNRRYYIHHTLKGVIDIRAKAKIISISEEKRSELTERQQKKIDELHKKFNYTIQIQLELTNDTAQTPTEFKEA